jgi:hypothetical protein
VRRVVACLALLLAASPALGQSGTADAETFFELKIRPVLTKTCAQCHAGKEVKGGLRMDGREALLKGGKNGPALVPGDLDRSLLIQALRRTHKSVKMPPDKKLPDEQVADFETWVKQGAVWPQAAAVERPTGPKHWAFQPVKRLDPPIDSTHASENEIDRFILSKLRAEGLKQVGLADKRTLIRRATFDLIGLPPTPAEVEAFLADDAPDAFRKVVDRLLASPRYGERWGRHWMDVARYADTAGDNADYPLPEIRLYRDYIIDSFNADKPYDRFVQEQLAGDILAKQNPKENYAEQVIATGFFALSRRYATAPYELWHLTLEDTIETTGSAFLGLTLRCARCHDHKFDPTTTRDYYGLYAIFAGTTFPYGGSEEMPTKGFAREHFVPLLPPGQAAPKLEAYRHKIKELEIDLSRLETEDSLARFVTSLNQKIDALQRQVESRARQDQDAEDLKAQQAELAHLRDQTRKQLLDKLNGKRSELRMFARPGLPPDLPGAYAVSEGRSIEVHIHLKGDPDNPGPVAQRSVPEYLAGTSPISFPEDGSGRLQLAQWLTRPEHPLTGRVIVNRVWQYHFGRGIVGTPSNFGVRGEAPTHPELLDWLTSQFIKDGWSIKALHRRIMLSRTYQLAATDNPENAAQDPDNRMHWRFNRRRLDAEALRDSLLSVSGNMNLTRPGPQPFPPISQWGWTQHNPFKEVYPSNHRTVYLMTQRIQRHPYLALFDGPDTNHSTEQRTSSTVPLQALYLLNNEFVKARAEGLARTLLAKSSEDGKRIELAFALAWSRPPQSAEVDKGLAYLQRYKEALAEAGVPEDKRELEAWTSYARVMLTANEFLYVD